MTSQAAPDASPPRRVRRKQGDLVLTGRGGYLDDIELPGTLHATVVRSTEASADLLEVDLEAARRAPGVRWAMDGHELAEHVPALVPLVDPSRFGLRSSPTPVLAVDRIRYEGEPIAVVVADTLAQAEAAADTVQVTYSRRPAVLDAETALADDAALLFPEWKTNAIGEIPFSDGDPDARYAQAPHVLEGEMSIQRYNAAPLETRGYLASWGADERLTLYASTQNPHPLRTQLAEMFKLPPTQIHVIATRMGGGFGHKFAGFPEEVLVCVLSRLVGAPVKWIETRAESMLVGGREYLHRFSVAFDDQGRILALRDRILGDIGALGTSAGWGMVYVAGMTFPGPYLVADYDVQAVPVVTNKPPWNGAIGYGKESASLVLERMVDMIAHALGIDPVDVRLTNFIPADAFPYFTKSKRLDSGDYAAALRAVLELGDYTGLRHRQAIAQDDDALLGVGVALELCPEGSDSPGVLLRGYDTSTVRIDPMGSVAVLTGVTSPGTGNETGIAQVVAAELGLDVEQVSVWQGDTDISPYGYGNFSSRGMNVGGGAAVLAARELKTKLRAAAAGMLQADPESLVFHGGRIRPGDGDGIAFADVVRAIYDYSIALPALGDPQLEATRTYHPPNLLHIPDEAGRTSSYPTFPYSAHLALVEVDRDTGVVRVLEYSCVHDCGVIINQNFVDGQLLGSIALGIGGALWEALPYTPDGHLTARTFKHQLLPRAPDLPPIRLGHQVTPSPFTVLGTKGAGESGVAGAIAVMSCAVNDALKPLGIHAHTMPLSPPNVLRALQEAGR